MPIRNGVVEFDGAVVVGVRCVSPGAVVVGFKWSAKICWWLEVFDLELVAINIWKALKQNGFFDDVSGVFFAFGECGLSSC